MITLTNERGLVTNPQSWDEIETLPGYKNGIDPDKHKLKAVIGSYHLKNVHCGLSCNQPHDKGYIVLTQSGVVTNLGNVCGSNHFGLDFVTYRNQHHRDLTENNNRDLIYTFSFQVDDLSADLQQIRNAEFGVYWVYKTSQHLKERGKNCPDSIVREINSMVKAGSNLLEKQREATSEEIVAIQATQTKAIQKPHYVTDKVAAISGLELFAEGNDLKQLVIVELVEKIKEFKCLDIEQLSFSELAYWAKWVNSIQSTKDKIIFSLEAGLKLLNTPNLEPFKEVISDAKELQLFNKFLKNLPSEAKKVRFEL